MFSVNSYLHIPTKKVIKKGINGYNFVGGKEGEIQGLFTEDTEGGWLLVAPLSECEPLVTLTLDEGVTLTDGDVEDYYGTSVFSSKEVFDDFETPRFWSEFRKKIGSFFDNPAYYSQLVWNCSEEEGWKRLFTKLNINS